MSLASVLETRGLHTLSCEKPIDGLTMDTKHASDAHGVEPAVVDQSPNRLGMHAELSRDLADADETPRFSTDGRHSPSEASQVLSDAAWAGGVISPTDQA